MENQPTLQPTAKVETVALALIKPYWRNARNIEAAIPGVVASIRDYGYNEYMVVDKDYVIIAGHTRYKALQELGYTEIPVIVAEHLPEEKVRQYRIADNKTNEKSTWIYEDLAAEMKTFPDIKAMMPYFPEQELSKMVDTSTIDNVLKKSQEDITNMQKQEAAKFAEASKKEISEYVDVTCPHCMKDFSLKRADVLGKVYKDPVQKS